MTILQALCHLDRSEAEWRDPAKRPPQNSKKIYQLQTLSKSLVYMTNNGIIIPSALVISSAVQTKKEVA